MCRGRSWEPTTVANGTSSHGTSSSAIAGPSTSAAPRVDLSDLSALLQLGRGTLPADDAADGQDNAGRPGDEEWLSRVEVRTSNSPHRRAWMGPQFAFKVRRGGKMSEVCRGSGSLGLLLLQRYAEISAGAEPVPAMFLMERQMGAEVSVES